MGKVYFMRCSLLTVALFAIVGCEKNNIEIYSANNEYQINIEKKEFIQEGKHADFELTNEQFDRFLNDEEPELKINDRSNSVKWNLWLGNE
ncbi:hypothetical protein V4T45_003976 [Vibrio vulnificus]|nr:hypothetical protein [Vibrio vulnificus]ELR8772607.1 hypothetical protein [Vibrio vulnificus]